MKKFICYTIALTPGSVAFMQGKYKKALLIFLLFAFVGLLYRASGILGMYAFVLGFIGGLSFYVSLCIHQIRDAKNSMPSLKAFKGILFVFVAIVSIKLIMNFLSLGNVYTMASNTSMVPVINQNEYVYVSKVHSDFQFGDIALYDYQDNPFLGIVCGVSGDTMYAADLKIFRNDQSTNCGIPEFIPAIPTVMDTFKVPENSFFIVKPNGLDSTFLKSAFSQSDMKGKVLFKVKDVPAGKWIESLYRLFDRTK